MNGESELLVPALPVRTVLELRGKVSLPLRCLSTSSVSLCLLGLLAQPHGTVWILLANGLSIWQVSGSINDCHQSADFGSI